MQVYSVIAEAPRKKTEPTYKENTGMENNKQQTSKTKKIIGIVVNVILWIFVAFSVFVTIVAVSASTSDSKVPTLGNHCYMSVLSGSMDAQKPAEINGVSLSDKPEGFKEGDLLVCKYIYGDKEQISKLSVGDVVTFTFQVGQNKSVESYNTHRIIELRTTADGKVEIKTQGDNHTVSPGPDNNGEFFSADRVIAVYTGKKASGLGGALTFLNSRLGFGLCILLPLAAFFIYQLVVFIRTVLKVKNADKRVISAADEELIKQQAIEEYLRQQELAKAEQQQPPSPESKDE